MTRNALIKCQELLSADEEFLLRCFQVQDAYGMEFGSILTDLE